MKIWGLLLLFLLVNPALSAASSDEALKVKANYLCSLIQKKFNLDYKNNFSESFRNAISEDQAAEVFASIYRDYGPCLSTRHLIVEELSDGVRARIYTKFESGREYKFNVLVKYQLNVFDGLQAMGVAVDEAHSFKSIDEVKKAARGFSGNFAIYAGEFNKVPLVTYNQNALLAIASEFKLYVLGVLAEQIKQEKITWDDKIKIREELLSFGTSGGGLDKAKIGEEYSVFLMASKMISRSDNTATDHLIDFVGRQNIEKYIDVLNSFYSQNKPLLKTLDLFRLRTLPTHDVIKFMDSSYAVKENTLKYLQQKLSRDKTLQELIDQNWENPKDIDVAEWFGSRRDMCKAMEWLKNQKNETVMKILSINSPVVDVTDSPHFSYGGFKGGSEPGVVTMTHIFKTKSGRWGCFSVGWNNTQEVVNKEKILEFSKALGNFVGLQLN